MGKKKGSTNKEGHKAGGKRKGSGRRPGSKNKNKKTISKHGGVQISFQNTNHAQIQSQVLIPSEAERDFPENSINDTGSEIVSHNSNSINENSIHDTESEIVSNSINDNRSQNIQNNVNDEISSPANNSNSSTTNDNGNNSENFDNEDIPDSNNGALDQEEFMKRYITNCDIPFGIVHSIFIQKIMKALE
jgi:hypothetical protein